MPAGILCKELSSLDENLDFHSHFLYIWGSDLYHFRKGFFKYLGHFQGLFLIWFVYGCSLCSIIFWNWALLCWGVLKYKWVQCWSSSGWDGVSGGLGIPPCRRSHKEYVVQVPPSEYKKSWWHLPFSEKTCILKGDKLVEFGFSLYSLLQQEVK